VALAVAALAVLSGFDTTRHNIPVEEILAGGPPKDGIPALLKPKFVSAEAADFLSEDDRVLGVAAGPAAKAYPLRILNWHEVVNDVLGDRPVAVTYCPLTASGVVYDRKLKGKVLSFGVSGRLYQSNVLMYDHQTESLWSQLQEEAVTGSYTGAGLRFVPSVETTWGAWRRLHPKTLVLSVDTGYRRPYDRDPYASYRVSPDPMFPVRALDRRLPAKEKVLGLRLGGRTKAYVVKALKEQGRLRDRIGGRKLAVTFDRKAGSAQVVDERGKLMPAVVVYWFAWAAFHPGTEIWQGAGGAAGSRGDGQPRGKAEGSPEVSVTEHSAYWTEVFGLGGFGSPTNRGPTMFVVRGTLRNRLKRDLHHVKLAFELLDGEGRIVASEEGYNRLSESLRKLDSPFPVNLEADEPRPIPGSGSDSFRMIFLRDETPRFESYRIRVIESPQGAAD